MGTGIEQRDAVGRMAGNWDDLKTMKKERIVQRIDRRKGGEFFAQRLAHGNDLRRGIKGEKAFKTACVIAVAVRNDDVSEVVRAYVQFIECRDDIAVNIAVIGSGVQKKRSGRRFDDKDGGINVFKGNDEAMNAGNGFAQSVYALFHL